MSIDYPTNRLTLYVTRRTPAIVRELERLIGANIASVAEGNPPVPDSIPPSNFACETYITSCNPLRGGIEAENSNGNHVCTLAFNAYRQVDGQAMILSAGHCPNSVYHSQAAVGPVWAESNGGRADAQSIHVVSGWNRGRWTISHQTAQAYAITAVYRGTNLSGFTVCLTGVTSGPYNSTALCGAVLDHDWDGTDSTGREFRDQFTYAVDSSGGDSGGPVYSNGRARGVHWGGSGTTAFASYAMHVENLTGVDIRTD